MATPKKTPSPLTFPVRSPDTWADAYQYVLTACREAGIDLPLSAKQTPLLWKVRLKDLPVEQFDHLLHSLVDQVEMLRGITPEQRESLRTGYDLGTLTHEVDMYLRATRNRTSRGSDLSELGPAALDRHLALFGRPPQLAVADGGFASPTNEHAAGVRHVRHVVLPRHPRATRSRAARAALRWRTGSEGRISALKRCHGLRRCRYRGSSGMQRWVGLGVIANNLKVLGRAGPRAA